MTWIKEKEQLKRKGVQFFALLVILFFLNLPLIHALEISNITATVTDVSANIRWQTDTEADSFVSYGLNVSELNTKGDANPVILHSFLIDSLLPATQYFFKVASGNLEDNNSGNFYTFTTLAPDTLPPKVEVNASSMVAGSTTTISGRTETGAQVKLSVNGQSVGSTPAFPVEINESEKLGEGLDGQFQFTGVILNGDAWNDLLIQVSDEAGNNVTWNGSIFSDIHKPKLQLENLLSITDKSSLEVKGNISENATYEIFLNNRSLKMGEGMFIKESVTLSEGENNLTIIVTDYAGWENSYTQKIFADTKPIDVKAEIEKGYEYFERPLGVTSGIYGKTKPGAKVYLYVYRVVGSSFHPDFKRDARAVTTADSSGNFSFSEVNFASLITDMSLKDLGPKEVPSNLLDIATYPIQEVAQQQYSTYQIYIIAESPTGKTNYWQHPVTVHACYSGLAFSIESINQFQGPLRLIPSLLDQGRQEIQAAFEFKYLGTALPEGEEAGFKINSVSIEPACTQGMRNNEDKFGLGCKILPVKSYLIKSGDGTKTYATWKLNSAQDWSKGKSSYWEQFQKSQVVFPLKISLNYQERTGPGMWSEPKTETACYDLGYFVDVPIDSSDMVPDFLANEGVDALNWTIDKIDLVSGYVKKAYLVAGISCMSATTLRTAMRWIRMFTSKIEAYYGTVKALVSDEEKKKKCIVNQNDLYLDSTLEAWKKMSDKGLFKNQENALSTAAQKAIASSKGNPEWDEASLNKRCPSTASMWKAEAFLDQVYRWVCDRAFCRAVPARWTEEKELNEINRRILEQKQCGASAAGLVLEKVENCEQYLQKNQVIQSKLFSLKKQDGNKAKDVCWRFEGALYYQPYLPEDSELNKQGIYHLEPIGPDGGGTWMPSMERLIVYNPLKSNDNFIAGRDVTCKSLCERKPGYTAIPENCLSEKIDKNGKTYMEVSPNQYDAGYTHECFVTILPGGQTKFERCICEPRKDALAMLQETRGSREAAPKEEWFYQQYRVYEESGHKSGTHYPEVRYYSGRDLSSAFGANYLLDYARPGTESESKVDPHNQIIGTLQTLCLSGIYKNLQMLKSILEGLKNCIIEAKYTGLHDAGMCKTLFSQHVCGLVYKVLSLFNSGCSQDDFSGVNSSGVFGDVGAIISGGYTSMNQALETGVQDLKKDYGNARLNQYFDSGGQGVAQSICLAAFGYEIPIFSQNFLMDAAYAFPSKTSVIVAPAFRELSTFNPVKQSAIFNYEIGAAILPGCGIARYSISLKCIGPEDANGEGADITCMGQGCDCMSTAATVDAGRERQIKVGNNLESGQFFDVPLESPLLIADSPYRYDHVVVKLMLDPSEIGNENKCFDSKTLQGNMGVYYFPIKDVSPPSQLNCMVDAISGRYICPEISKVFGWGETYLEEPYIDCWEERSQTWVSCNAVKYQVGDKMAVRAHVNNDGKGQCLRRRVQGIPGLESETIRTLPSDVGSKIIADDLGTVSEMMFGASGSYSSLILAAGSSPGCQSPQYTYSSTMFGSPQRYEFTFLAPAGATQGKLSLPNGAIPSTPGYIPQGGLLVKLGTGQDTFTLAEINSVNFQIGGFSISNVISSVSPTVANPKCIYESTTQRTGSGGGSGTITVTYEILDKEGVGNCMLANKLVKPIFGKASHQQIINVLKEDTSTLLKLFRAGNYDNLIIAAREIQLQGRADLVQASAVYYSVAARIMKGNQLGDPKKYQLEIVSDLGLFFSHLSGESGVEKYSPSLSSDLSFKKVNKYLCEVDLWIGGTSHNNSTLCP